MTNELPKPRNANEPFCWESLSPEDSEQAKNEWLASEHEQDIKKAICDSDAAVKLLEAAAGYLERREQMPFHLADYIAQAFRATAKGKESDTLTVTEARRNTLAMWLNITAPGKRPKATDEEIGLNIFRLMLERATNRHPLSETAAAKEVAAMFGIGLQTAKDHWKKWKDSNPETYELLKKYVKAYMDG